VVHTPVTIPGFLEDEARLLAAGDLDVATELNVRTWLGPDADDATRDRVRAIQRHALEVQKAGGTVPATPAEYDPASITTPALVIAGADDLALLREGAVALARRMPGARHLELDWAGHLPYLERPETVNRLLADFLAQHTR
jgi:3-oxoadipate enol-lactonase